MCDWVPSTLLFNSSVLSTYNLGFNSLPTPRSLTFLWYSNRKPHFICTSLKPYSSTSINAKPNASPLSWDEFGFSGEIEIKEKVMTGMQWKTDGRDVDEAENLSSRDGIEDAFELDEEKRGNEVVDREKDELVKSKASSRDVDSVRERRRGKGWRQIMKRSGIIAKHVISINSALSLGFVSQLWVDINSRGVLLVEVRPNLLSGEMEWFLLEDVKQVGDVLLVKDESVLENQFNLAGLETLVGYNVVTQGRQNIGKVRDYTFNINTGVVESLEIDSLGIPIIPSSLVNTYGLFVEDIVAVLSDTIIVQQAASSHLQRLTKGFWSGQKTRNYVDELDDYADLEQQHPQSDYGKRQRRKSSRKNFKKQIDDWELPMDFI